MKKENKDNSAGTQLTLWGSGMNPISGSAMSEPDGAVSAKTETAEKNSSAKRKRTPKQREKVPIKKVITFPREVLEEGNALGDTSEPPKESAKEKREREIKDKLAELGEIYQTLSEVPQKYTPALYRSIKEQVKNAERNNYGSLFVFQSTNGYYKMIDHSALVYYDIVAPQLGKEVRIFDDRDVFARSSDGVVSIKGIRKLAISLAAINIQLIHFENGIAIFKLNQSFDKMILAKIRQKGKALEEELNHNIYAKDPNIEAKKRLRTIESEGFILMSNVSRNARAFVIDEIPPLIHRLSYLYYLYSNDKISAMNWCKRSLTVVDEILPLIDIAFEIKATKVRTLVRFSTAACELKTILNAELKNTKAAS